MRMSPKVYGLTTAIVFSLIALLQLLRLTLRWEAMVNGRSVPLWPSAIAVVIAGYLAFEGFRQARKPAA